MFVVMKRGVPYGPFFEKESAEFYIGHWGTPELFEIVQVKSPDVPQKFLQTAPETDPNPEL